MKIIHANSSATLVLGRCGENLARKVIFDITDFENLYGVGTVEILYQRPNDAQPYPLAVQRDGTSITWNVTATDTATPSEFGKCELRYYSGETLVKSKIWQTWVENALSTPSETTPPEPEQGWVDQVLDAKQTAEKAAVDAKADADRAAVLAAEVTQNASQVAQNVSYTNEAKEAAVLSASEAAQSAQEAAGSASVALTSETNAKASEDATKSSETNAAGSASAAAKSATAAQTAQSGAEAAQSAAQKSATSAAESAAVYGDVVADVTQLKQDLASEQTAREQADASLQQDISGKLPKSPADWEPWTAEEQAAARERIGIPGNYELIHDETITEGIYQYTIDNISLKKAIIVFHSVSHTSNNYLLVDLTLDAAVKGSCSTIRAINKDGFVCYYYAYCEEGVFHNLAVGPVRPNGATTSNLNNFSKFYFAETITAIKLRAYTSSEVIPSGCRIQVYGVIA